MFAKSKLPIIILLLNYALGKADNIPKILKYLSKFPAFGTAFRFGIFHKIPPNLTNRIGSQKANVDVLENEIRGIHIQY